MFKVDYNNAGFVQVKPGEYEVIPLTYDITIANNSGNERLIVNYEIRSDVEQPCKGQEIKFDNFTVHEKSMWRFNQAMKAAGIPDGTDILTLKEWAEAFMNRPVRVVVGEREYQGKTFPDVQMFKETLNPITATRYAPAPTSDDDLPF